MFMILNGYPLDLAEFASFRTNTGLRVALPSKLNQESQNRRGFPHQRPPRKELLLMLRMVQPRNEERPNPL